MKLPYPFQSATGIQATSEGSVYLTDRQDKPLARVPLHTAWGLIHDDEVGKGQGDYGHSYDDGPGDGYGLGYGYGSGSGYGYGMDIGQSDGSGSP